MGARAYALPDSQDTLDVDVSASLSSEGQAWRHIALLAMMSPVVERAQADDLTERWLAACYRLTPLVERIAPFSSSSWSAALDLGVCTDEEALAVLQPLLEHLRLELHIEPRVGVASSLVLAQLAALTNSTGRLPVSPVFVPPAKASAFLRQVPVTFLPRLHPAGSIPHDTVERLHRYGLSTMGHLARLGELALRRQFGSAVGAALAAVAAGRDLRPLQPTPQPERLHFRLRFTTAPATPDRALVLLPAFLRRISGQLRRSGRRAREIRLAVRWENGGSERVHCVLRQHTDAAVTLTAAAERLLFSLLQVGQTAHAEGTERAEEAEGPERLLDELQLTLLDLAPAIPEQSTFWRTDRQRAEALERVAETLSRRHGRPLVLRPELHTADAVFSEDCHHLVAAGAPGAAGAIDAAETLTETGRTLVRPVTATADIWQDVPVRLHWW